MSDIIDSIQQHQTAIIIGSSVIAILILWNVIANIVEKCMRHKVFLCVEYFIRHCHNLDFYKNYPENFCKFSKLYKSLNKRRKAWYYTEYLEFFIEHFLKWYEMVDFFSERTSKFIGEGHYFTHSEFLYCMEGVDMSKTNYFLSSDFIEYVHEKEPKSLISIEKYQKEIERGFSDIPQTHNIKFVKDELENNKSYFDSLLRYPLDQQQRESIVKLEDNCLVISSAGSGKTTTTVGKVRYLVDKRKIDPSKLLLITYTRKAAGELSERLSLAENGLSCNTFHGLAFDIVTEITKKKPTICESSLMLQCFYHLIDTNPDFKEAINLFLTVKSSLTKNLHDYHSASSYYSDRALYGIQAPFLDMDGKIIFTRSEEEKKICTFLSMNNVSYRYEEPYKYDTNTEYKKQYRPDFTIYFNHGGKTYYLILEHFGIDDNKNVPIWFGDGIQGGWAKANKDYNEEIVWKREINQKYNIAMIETTSAMFQDGTIFDKLTEQLRSFGVELRPLTEDEKFEKLVKRNKRMEDSILQLITSFITLMKSNCSTVDSIMDVIKKDCARQPVFIERSRFMLYRIFFPIFKEYQKELADKKLMDYTDLILMATRFCEQGRYKKEFDTILVDEFQDISIDRFRFLQSLRRKSPLTKLYCVGDDWQSIFRFSGSDLSLFNSFEEYFGFTERCKIEHTYRFGEPLIKLSSAFILKNERQVHKEVKPNDNSKKTEITMVEYNNEDKSQLKVLTNIVNSIREDETIMLLGRYHSDAEFIPKNNVLVRDQKGNVAIVRINGREMRYNTIHSAKGLEADNVILVNCSQDGNGFPSKVSDDPILGFVLSKPDTYPFAEERRLFYVAVTRAKKNTYVLYKDTCPSPFISEILEPTNESLKDIDKLVCPMCRNGYLRTVKEGTSTYCASLWRFYRCTNSTAGCDYTWFVNYTNDESLMKQYQKISRPISTAFIGTGTLDDREIF